MRIINNNVATGIKHLQKNMVALENLASSENLAPPAPLRIQPPLPPNNKAPTQLPPFCLGEAAFYGNTKYKVEF